MENQRNRHKSLSAKTSSTYKGTHYNNAGRGSKPWVATITLSGEYKYLGCYRTQEEAALAYNKAAIEHFGQYANLNIITP